MQTRDWSGRFLGRGRRCVIRTAEGYSYSGRWPQDMANKGEGPYIAALAHKLGGSCEVVVPFGRADVATPTHIFEVEPARSWRIGVRQVLAYSAQTGMKPALALFGDADYLRIYLYLRDRVHAADIELWRWNHGHWGRCSSRSAASLKTSTTAPGHPRSIVNPRLADL